MSRPQMTSLSYRPHKRLTRQIRKNVIDALKKGTTWTEIKSQCRVGRSTISTIAKELEDEYVKNSKGRHRSYTAAQERVWVKSLVKLDNLTPPIAVKHIFDNYGQLVSHNIIKRILKRLCMKYYSYKRKPYLSPRNVNRRYEWAKEHLHWTTKNWEDYC